MPFVVKTVDIFCGIDYPGSPDAETLYACCEPGNDQFGFWGDEILLSTGETISRDDYQSLTNEFVVSHSYAKHSLYQGKSYSVGALARINNLGERLTGEAEIMLQKYYHDKWKTNPFAPVLKDGKVYGRGAEDNGQDLAAALFAFKAIKELRIPHKKNLGLILVSDEETGSKFGFQHVIKKNVIKEEDEEF